MTSEQLHKANKINGQIALIDEIEKDFDRFKKTKFSGSLPSSMTRYIQDNPDVALKIVDVIMADAVNKKIILQGQWNEI